MSDGSEDLVGRLVLNWSDESDLSDPSDGVEGSDEAGMADGVRVFLLIGLTLSAIAHRFDGAGEFFFGGDAGGVSADDAALLFHDWVDGLLHGHLEFGVGS